VKKSKFIEDLKKNHKVILLALISLLVFNKYIVMIGFFIILGLIGIASLKVTRLMPHISIETISASAVLMGFVWGWKIGLIFGFVVGLYGYVNISLIKLKPIINVILMGLCGICGALFHSLGYEFRWAFFMTFVVRLILNNIIFPLVESDFFENLMHGVGDPIFNMLITSQLMYLLYKLILLFGGGV